MNTYRTIQETDDSVETTYEIQKSRFITHVCHVENEEDARAFVQSMKKRYFDARHNCSAWVLGELADKQKSNDDGEPGGTAGNPILEAIHKNGLTNVVVVVTRYFGGIKLGAGGLIRAYGHAAVLGLNEAVLLEMTPFQETAITISYDLLYSNLDSTRQENFLQALSFSRNRDNGGQPQVHVLEAELERELADNMKWVLEEDFKDYAFAVPQQKMWEIVKKHERKLF